MKAPESTDDLRVPEIRTQTIRGAGWSTIEGAASQGLAFVVFLFMARLLSPTDFGLVALANLYVMLAQFLIFCGLGPAVVQSKEYDEENFDTAFWLQMAVGLGFFGLTIGLPAVVADFFGTRSLTPIVAALSPIFIFSALCSMQNAVLSRQLDFRSLALRTLLVSIIGGAFGIALALLGYGVWSLVGQQLLSGLAEVVLLWRISPWRPRFRFSREKARRLVRFGFHAMAADLANLVSRRSGQYFVGKFLGPLQSGFFAIAARVSTLVSEIMIRSLGRVTLSSFSRLQGQPDRFAAAFYRVVGMQSVLVLPVSIGLALLVPEVITVLFGAKWLPAAPTMQVLLLGSGFEALTSVHNSTLTGAGRPDWCNWLTCAHLTLNLVGFAIAVRWGMEAVALASLVRAAVLYPVELVVLKHCLGLSPWESIRRVLPLLVVTAAMAAAVVAVKQVNAGAALTLGLATLAGTACFVGALYLLQRAVFTEMVACLRIFRRGPLTEMAVPE
ncbi:MAG: lipopolysaccharide biosynthesis protein [Chthoniobacter sp.]|uniref:lipopolysaccharide biosynthesis protein n=1 Tax=Chthoniobacter sp. TaxID=2510640 RepID=UPI0032ABC775